MKSIRKIHFLKILPYLMLLIFFYPSVSCFSAETENRIEEKIGVLLDKLQRVPDDRRITQELGYLYHCKASSHAASGEWQSAIDDEEEAYKYVPSEPAVTSALAYYYNEKALELYAQKKLRPAIEDLKRAVELQPDKKLLRKNLGSLYLNYAEEKYNNGEYEYCGNLLTEAERYARDNAYLYFLKGELSLVRDNYFDAKKNWEQALKIDPSFPGVKEKLKKILQDEKLESHFSATRTGNFRIKFEGVEDRDTAEKAADVLRQAYRDVGRDLDHFPRTLIPVIIYPDDIRGETDYFPDWAAGTYDGKIRLMKKNISNGPEMKSIIFHEYTHVIVYELAKTRAPLWLNEGLAGLEASRFRRAAVIKEREKLLREAAKNKSLFSFQELSSLRPEGFKHMSRKRIELFYAQSESYVAFLEDKFSFYNIKKYLLAVGGGRDREAAFKAVFSRDEAEIFRLWQNHLTGEII